MLHRFGTYRCKLLCCLSCKKIYLSIHRLYKCHEHKRLRCQVFRNIHQTRECSRLDEILTCDVLKKCDVELIHRLPLSPLGLHLRRPLEPTVLSQFLLLHWTTQAFGWKKYGNMVSNRVRRQVNAVHHVRILLSNQAWQGVIRYLMTSRRSSQFEKMEDRISPVICVNLGRWRSPGVK